MEINIVQKLVNSEIMLKIGTELKELLKNEILEDIGWKSVSWSGNDTGGIITTDMDMRNKLVSLRFKSPTNDYHNCHVTFFWGAINNYLMAQMYNVTQYILCTNTTSTGFKLIIPSTIKLDKIHYLNL